ncbi:MAG: 16S rRNA (guanine(966)-N(2))-methyltransferase RsmD [Tahibacter sp.]
MLRIIGGQLRGSRIAVADRPGLRPTPDRVRETLFNWLMASVAGARCLDLYAGTGALGIEALSRGAREVVFVERDALLAGMLRDVLGRLKQTAAHVLNDDAARALPQLTGLFDVVFLDPPFDAELWTPITAQLEQSGCLADAALVYVESPALREPVLPRHWQLHKQARSGDVRHALYRRGARG